MAKVTREKRMAVTPQSLVTAITDFEAYPRFVPEVVSAKRFSGGSDRRYRALFELEIVKRFQYTLEFTQTGLEEIRWDLVESDFFKLNRGRWLIRKVEEQLVDVTYEVEIGLGFLVPGWITRKLTEVTLPRMLENFEGRAKECMGKGR